jgi:hypothetical protein
MTPDETQQLRHVPLLIEPSSDPISGLVAGKPFTGWAQLAAAIEAAAGAAPVDEHGVTPQPPT